MKKKSNIQPVIIIFIALALFFFIRMFIIDILVIKGRSMEPAYRSGDMIVINKTAYGILIPFINTYLVRWADPGPGDIVVFKNPGEKKLVIKRCAGIAGDPISLTDDGLVVGKHTIPFRSTEIDSFHFTTESVPENSIFVLGDNLGESVDSRHFGFIDKNTVCGRAISVNS